MHASFFSSKCLKAKNVSVCRNLDTTVKQASASLMSETKNQMNLTVKNRTKRAHQMNT